MKNIKQKLVIISTIMAFTSLLLAMDAPTQSPEKSKKKPSRGKRLLHSLQKPLEHMSDVLVAVTGKAIKPTQINWNDVFDFMSLPNEVKGKIIEYLIEYSSTENYNKAIRSIMNLASVSKDIYNKTFQDIRFCYNIIKNISYSFNQDNARICRDLKLPQFEFIYSTQLQLLEICRNTQPISFHRLNDLITQNPSLDFSFTYGTGTTPLQTCVLNFNIPIITQIIKLGEKNGTLENSDIYRSLYLAIPTSTTYGHNAQRQKEMNEALQIITLLIPVLKNITDPELIQAELSSLLVHAIENNQIIIIRLLLEAGADPRIRASRESGYPPMARIPLDRAQNRPEILAILNNWINN